MAGRLERPHGEDLTVFTPLSLPWRGEAAVLRKADQHYFVRQIRNAIARYPERDPILFVGNPWNVFLLDAFSHAACTVYHCSDNFMALYKGGLREEAERRETALIRRADFVACSHPDFLRKCSKLGGKGCYLPHGVDERFIHTPDRQYKCPSDLVGIPHPIIGLIGSLDRGIDFDLLARAADVHLDKSFVLIGPLSDERRDEAAALARHANCHILDAKPWSALPDYLSQFDAALVPFVINDFNLGRSPLKLIEYMAAGLPVVSTALRLEEPLRPFVFVAGGPDDFVGLIDVSLAAAQDHNRRDQQTQFVREHYTWERRTEQFSELVLDAMRAKTN